MHVISKKAIQDFYQNHPQAKSPLEAWYRIVKKTSFISFIEVKESFNATDYVPPYTVFNVGGNKFRVITSIQYNRQKLYIHKVLTHAEYDRWNASYRSKKHE